VVGAIIPITGTKLSLMLSKADSKESKGVTSILLRYGPS
jgi:hypothetical protein